MNSSNLQVNKLDSVLGQVVHLQETGAPGHVDVVGLVNTIRLRRYGWNTSKEGSLRRKKTKKKKNKVEEIQLADLASL